MPIRPSVAWPCATPTREVQLVAQAAPGLGQLPHAVAHRDGEPHGARGGIRAGQRVVEEGGQPPVAGEAVDRGLEPVQQLAGAAVVLAQHGHDVLGLDALRERDEALQPARDDGDLAPVAVEERLVARGDEQLRDLRREEPPQPRRSSSSTCCSRSRLVEALELGGLRLDRVVVALDPQQRPDARQQLRRHERLRARSRRRPIRSRCRLLLVAARRDHHDGQEAGAPARRAARGRPRGRPARHHDVEQDEVDRPRRSRSSASSPERAVGDRVAARLEHRLAGARRFCGTSSTIRIVASGGQPRPPPGRRSAPRPVRGGRAR